MLVLAPGVLAVRCRSAHESGGRRAFAQRLFAAGEAHAVLAVPIAQDRATMHLDTVCTMVDRDAVVMYPPLADSLEAYVVEEGGVSGPSPFLEAAAAAMDIPELRVIDTGLDPVTAEREQWDDGNNTLALEPGVVVAYERNLETNARLVAEGIEVIPDRRLRARHGPRRPALHVVPDCAGLTAWHWRLLRSVLTSRPPGAATRKLAPECSGRTRRGPPIDSSRLCAASARCTASVGVATGGRLGHLLCERSRSSPFGPEGPCRPAAGAGRRARLNDRCAARAKACEPAADGRGSIGHESADRAGEGFELQDDRGCARGAQPLGRGLGVDGPPARPA